MCSYGYKTWSIGELKSEALVPELLNMSDDEKREYEAGLKKFKELVDKGCEMQKDDVPFFSEADVLRARSLGVIIENEKGKE